MCVAVTFESGMGKILKLERASVHGATHQPLQNILKCGG